MLKWKIIYYNNYNVEKGSTGVLSKNKILIYMMYKQKKLVIYKRISNEKVIYSLHIKHSSGHGGISVKLLKFLAPALVRPLTLLVN